MTGTDVEIHGGSDLTITADQRGFTAGQVAALQQIGVQDATEGDLAVFFHQAQRTGLDPFARQIYMIGRKAKIWDPQTKQERYETRQTIQTGIDGFRLIARRAADARGETFSMDDVLWADPDGNWHDLWIWDTPPAAAKVTVHLGSATFSAVAATREYMQTTKAGKPSGQWGRMPAVMIAKCAEALALRKAFPQDLSGIYTGDEMGQADQHMTIQPAPRQQAPQPEPPHVTDFAEISACEDVEQLRAWWSHSPADVRQVIEARVSDLQTVDAEVVDADTGEVQAAFPEGDQS